MPSPRRAVVALAAAVIMLCLPSVASARPTDAMRSADLFGAAGLADLEATAAGAPMYPDLRTLPPRDLQWDTGVTTTKGTNRTVLRFTNTVWNAGEGPVIMNADVPAGTTSAPAMQVVDYDDGSTQSYNVGNYVIHPAHQHFHYDDWGRYELWTKSAYDAWIAAGRPAGTEPDLVGSKTSSCVLDGELVATLATTTYPGAYNGGGCDPTKSGRIRSGLSVGWGDTYDAYRDEQWVDVGTSKLPNGTYVLRSVADPDNKIYESPGKADASRESVAANEAITVFRVDNSNILDSDLPSGTVSVDDVAVRTNSTNVTVRVLGRDDVSGIDQVRVSNDGVTWDTRSYGGSGTVPMTIAWDLADTRYGGSTAQGTRTVYAQFHDRSGKWSPTTTDTIEYGSGAPGGGGSNSLYADAVMADAPTAYWRLGETSGAALDEVGSLDGTFAGPVARAVAGLLNSDQDRAARFNAQGTAVNIPESPSLALGSRFAVEAWIKPDAIPAAGDWASIVTRPEAYSLQFNGPRLEFTVIQNGVRRRLQAPAGAVVAGQTYHVVGSFDGATQKLYLNGAEVASVALSGAPSPGEGGLHIGSWDGSNEMFQGTIDEVAIYDTLVSGLSAKQHWDAGISTAVGVATPTGLSAASASTSQINLTWTDASNNETGFVVERSASASFTSPTDVTVPAGTTTYAATGLAAGTTYWFRVKAVTATDGSGWSNVASQATQAATTPPPATPAGVTATAASSARVDVKWTDASSDETGFEVQRSASSSFTSPTTFTAAANATTVADTTVAASTAYWYRVRSVRGTTTSAWTAGVGVTTPAGTTPPPASYAAAVGADNPISHWRLGETSGTAAADVKARNAGAYRQGILLNQPSLLSKDTANRAVAADGTNDWVEVADSATLDFTTAFSVEAWIRPAAIPAAGGWASVVTKAESYSIQFNGPRLEFTLMRDGVRYRLQAASGAIVAGRTYHVVGTYDGSNQRLYINGALAASRAQTGPATVGTWPLAIGSWSGFGEFFKGSIDEVAVYNTTLSAARVSAHFGAGGTPPAAAAARAARTTKVEVRRNPKPVSGALGPAQRLTQGLRGPGNAARRRACVAPRLVLRRARQDRRAPARACRAMSVTVSQTAG